MITIAIRTLCSASRGIQTPAMAKVTYAVGIGLILLSDTVISFTEFLSYSALNWLILPAYYLAHTSIAFSLLVQR